MEKLRKLFVSMLLMALIIAAVSPAAVYAADSKTDNGDMRLVYANVPDDWKNPCLWAWNEAGDQAYEAWPGEAMTPDSNNKGWYYIYAPSWADHIIVNANAGETQTSEIVLKDGNTWVTVKDKDHAEAVTEQQTKGNLPKYEETFKIHVKVDDSWKEPNLWAWSAPDGKNAFDKWPGVALMSGEKWYTGKAPTWVNSIIVNANGGDVKTEDISVDPAELWLTVDKDGKYDLSYVDPEKASVPNITVRVKAPSDWKSPNLWAWSAPDGTNAFASWPGETLEEKDGWLTKEVPGWVNSIIVNGNNGDVQTQDISVDAGKDVWIVVTSADKNQVYYEEPKDAEATSTSETVDEETDKPDTSKKQSKTTPVIPITVVVIIAVAVICIVVVARKKKNKA